MLPYALCTAIEDIKPWLEEEQLMKRDAGPVRVLTRFHKMQPRTELALGFPLGAQIYWPDIGL
jgi:hypothetical protein